MYAAKNHDRTRQKLENLWISREGVVHLSKALNILLTSDINAKIYDDNDSDSNYLYSAHKPKRRTRIWVARSRDQSRCVLKIMSFKMGFER